MNGQIKYMSQEQHDFLIEQDKILRNQIAELQKMLLHETRCRQRLTVLLRSVWTKTGSTAVKIEAEIAVKQFGLEPHD